MCTIRRWKYPKCVRRPTTPSCRTPLPDDDRPTNWGAVPDLSRVQEVHCTGTLRFLGIFTFFACWKNNTRFQVIQKRLFFKEPQPLYFGLNIDPALVVRVSVRQPHSLLRALKLLLTTEEPYVGGWPSRYVQFTVRLNPDRKCNYRHCV